MTPSDGPSSDSGRDRAGRRGRRSPSRPARAWLAAALAVAACWALGVAVAQEVEDITGAIEKYRGILTVAMQKLEDLDLPEALARFTEVIDGYSSGKLPAGTPLTRQIVGQAYDGRARTYANLGRAEEAEADFEALIRYDVSWPIDRTRTSPKIVAMYDKVRKKVVGTLAVSTEPPGAVVTLGGEPLGRSPIFDRELVSGTYALEVQAPGFEPVTEQISLQGGARLERSLRLVPNARSVLVATSPAGAHIAVDGEERGATFGAAGPEYAEVASRLGLAPAEISAPLLVEFLKPGDHLLKIDKDCFEPQLLTVKVAVDPNDTSPMRIEPIRLAQSQGDLSIASSPAGADVEVDGKSVGKAPLKMSGVCSGRHQVSLRRDDVGRWVGWADVEKGRTASIDERLRMTFAYVGVTMPGPAGQTPAGEAELGEALGRLTGVNVIRPGAGLPAEYLAGVTAATGADFVIAATPGEGAFERRLQVDLYAARYPALRQRETISLDDEQQLNGYLSKLSRWTTLSRPWLGARVIETRRAVNPLVIRVEPSSPAAKSGVHPGDAIVSLGGKPVATAADLDAALAALPVGAQASLTLQGPGAPPRQVNLAIGATPVMVRLDDPSILHPLLAGEMAFRARLEAALGRPSGAERSTSLLNLALVLMRDGQPEAALKEALQQVDLPDGPGISAGTVCYLKGICLQRLNRLTEARQQLERASGQPDATLWSHDGPAVADRAKRALAGP